MASPAYDFNYVYSAQSAVRKTDSGAFVALATSRDDAAKVPLFFDGRVVQPDLVGALMLAVSRVALSRYYLPPAMVSRLIRMADPVVTVAGECIRFESFSQCCGVYARLDLLPESLDGQFGRHGTTNVDFNEPMRAALAALRGNHDVRLAVGADHVRLEKDSEAVIERKVALPVRWLKGFVESQVYATRLRLCFETDGPQARRFLSGLSNQVKPADNVFVTSSGGTFRVSRSGKGMAAAGLGRLQVLKPVARQATQLRVYGCDDAPVSGWELTFPGARFTLILSGDVSRGFSGEGQVLESLAVKNANAAVARVRSLLAWQTDLSAEDLASQADATPDDIDIALAVLGSRGLIGYDPHDGTYFHRELPFDMAAVETLHPRLKGARRLVEDGAVELSPAGEPLSAFVAGSGTRHHVRGHDGGLTCTCEWYAKYKGGRGPCKHMLAVQIELEEQSHER